MSLAINDLKKEFENSMILTKLNFKKQLKLEQEASDHVKGVIENFYSNFLPQIVS